MIYHALQTSIIVNILCCSNHRIHCSIAVIYCAVQTIASTAPFQWYIMLYKPLLQFNILCCSKLHCSDILCCANHCIHCSITMIYHALQPLLSFIFCPPQTITSTNPLTISVIYCAVQTIASTAPLQWYIMLNKPLLQFNIMHSTNHHIHCSIAVIYCAVQTIASTAPLQ